MSPVLGFLVLVILGVMLLGARRLRSVSRVYEHAKRQAHAETEVLGRGKAIAADGRPGRRTTRRRPVALPSVIGRVLASLDVGLLASATKRSQRLFSAGAQIDEKASSLSSVNLEPAETSDRIARERVAQLAARKVVPNCRRALQGLEQGAS